MLAMLAFAGVPAGTASAQAPASPANTGGAAYGVIPAKPAVATQDPAAAAPPPCSAQLTVPEQS